MKIAVITDIHEDYKMLAKAFDTLKRIGYDMLVCLGDITGYASEFYGHKPNADACIDLIRENADIVLAGNHDLYSSQRLPSYHLEKNMPENWYELSMEQRNRISNNSLWLYEEEILPNLSAENFSFISKLEESCVVEVEHKNILFSHFVQPDLSGVGRWFPYRIGELKAHFKLMERLDCVTSFVGHFHPDALIIANKLYWSTPCYYKVKIKNKPRIVVCPPIVGNGKTGNFIIFDSMTNEITPYVFKK